MARNAVFSWIFEMFETLMIAQLKLWLLKCNDCASRIEILDIVCHSKLYEWTGLHSVRTFFECSNITIPCSDGCASASHRVDFNKLQNSKHHLPQIYFQSNGFRRFYASIWSWSAAKKLFHLWKVLAVFFAAKQFQINPCLNAIKLFNFNDVMSCKILKTFHFDFVCSFFWSFSFCCGKESMVSCSLFLFWKSSKWKKAKSFWRI